MWTCHGWSHKEIFNTDKHTHTRLMALFLGLPGWADTRKVKPVWTSLKHETVSGSGISWAICKSAPRSRQTTTPAPHHSVFYRPDALPAAQPTASKHWRDNLMSTKLQRILSLVSVYTRPLPGYLHKWNCSWADYLREVYVFHFSLHHAAF